MMSNNNIKLIDIRDFAEYIIHYFNSSGSLITNKKLQKLLYYAQAWHLVYFNGNTLFNDVPEAWVHGAVYPVIYRKYKKFKAKPISLDRTMTREDLSIFFDSLGFTEEQAEYINSVLLTYGKKEAFELEILNHREKPWLEARNGLDDFDLSSTCISLETMENYYSELVKKSNNEL